MGRRFQEGFQLLHAGHTGILLQGSFSSGGSEVWGLRVCISASSQRMDLHPRKGLGLTLFLWVVCAVLLFFFFFFMTLSQPEQLGHSPETSSTRKSLKTHFRGSGLLKQQG